MRVRVFYAIASELGMALRGEDENVTSTLNKSSESSFLGGEIQTAR